MCFCAVNNCDNVYTHDDDGDDDDHDHDKGKDDDNDDNYDYDDVKIMVNDVVCWCYITQKSCGNTFFYQGWPN